jgi:hypothetical protein
MADHETTIHPLTAQPSFPSQQFTDYLMLDSCGHVLEVRHMSSREARDSNLELEAHRSRSHWVSLASMND